MSRYDFDGWAPYVTVAERRKQAQREITRLRKAGRLIAPVIIETRAIAKTFWGKAWCENLESYHDFAYRLDRGRSYARNGCVVDLQIAPLEITALVSGSSLYEVKVSVKAPAKARWRSICQDCAGGIDSLVELLRGRFSEAVMERLCRQDTGLFPWPSEIGFSCSCLDHASMCKHVAGVLYGVGARLDETPELLFRLRSVDEHDLLANLDAGGPLLGAPQGANVLEADDLSALFGLEMASADPPGQGPGPVEPRSPASVRRPTPKARARRSPSQA